MTGISLNHGQTLKLDSIYLTWQPLLRWYGFKIADIRSFAAGSVPVNGETALEADIGVLIGAVELEDGIAVGGSEGLMLTTDTGQLLEFLKHEIELTKPLEAIGISQEKELVLRSKGKDYILNLDDLSTRSCQDIDVSWSRKPFRSRTRSDSVCISIIKAAAFRSNSSSGIFIATNSLP